MKTFAIIAVFCFAAVYAAIVAKDITALIERADELEARGHKIISEFQKHTKGHLISALEHEVQQLETITKTIKAIEANVTERTHELNALEESLLYHENRITEEMDFAMDLYSYNATGKTTNELIAFGEKLVAEAKAEITKHAGHGHREVLALEHEAATIQQLIKDIQAHPAATRKVDQDETQLVRHEMTLRSLVKRIEATAH